METKYARLDSAFVVDSYEKLNSQFARVRVRIAYGGRNRNGSYIEDELLDRMSKTSLLNIPIVGEYSEEKQNFLGHGGKIELSDQGIRFVDTTRPYGVVPSDTEVYREDVMDKDGYTTHSYLCCTAILWVGRYPEAEKVLEDGANQSMEIRVKDGHYADDGIFYIDDAEFSALCILGKDDVHPKGSPESTDVEPCFEDAAVMRYSNETFRNEFQLLVDGYKAFNSAEDVPVEDIPADLNIETPTESVAENDFKEGKITLPKELRAALESVLSEFKFRSNTDTMVSQYVLCSVCDEDSVINVVDRKAYGVYAVPYIATETEDGIVASLDFDNMVEKALIVGDAEDKFNLLAEVEFASEAASAFAVANYKSATIDSLTEQLKTLKAEFDAMKTANEQLTDHVALMEKEKAAWLGQKHKDEIDTCVAAWGNTMGEYSEYLSYKSKIDYAKELSVVEGELKQLHSDYEMGRNHQFGLISSSVIDEDANVQGDVATRQYGSEVAKLLRKVQGK